MAGKFYTEEMVRRLADETLSRWARLGGQIALPVAIEQIVESEPFDLGILWEAIPEPPGRTILAGLAPDERLIVLNETRRQLFETTPHLYRTVLAHELGHWCLHVDQTALTHPLLPGFDRPLQFVCQHSGDSWEERHAHWFASHLLLPRDLLASLVRDRPISGWTDLYALRDRCQVTITMLRIALEHMGCGYVDDDGRVHASRQGYLGQGRLF